jgi:prevent-host-death family protein
LEIADATQPMATYVQQTERGPVVLTDNGRPVAVIVAIENADMETASLSLNPKFLAIIERSRARREREGGLSSDEVRRQLGLPRKSPGKSPKRASANNRRKRTKTKARPSHAHR